MTKFAEIEKLINAGVSVEDITKAAKESSAKLEKEKATSKELESKRDAAIKALSAYILSFSPAEVETQCSIESKIREALEGFEEQFKTFDKLFKTLAKLEKNFDTTKTTSTDDEKLKNFLRGLY